MGKWLKRLFDGTKVLVLFTGSTIVFYYGMVWINQEYQYYHRYDEPSKGAVKASAMANEDNESWFERIVLFYLDGE